MGAYLSQPKTDKTSTDESNNYLCVGASSMQGWRNSQEDAHNSILNFDTDTAFFAVYDGHGGAEVSTYCADKLPQFLKTLDAYVNGNYEQALIDAFLGFDKTLLEPEVIEMLKILAGEKNFVDGDDSDAIEDDDDEDLAELHEEGNLPLDEVMEKYKGHPSMPSLKKLKDSNCSKPQSPYLRGRRAAAVIADAANRAELDPDSKPEGSSTSKAALEDGPSSSKSSSASMGNKMETEEDSTVSSSSSSASKSSCANNSAKNADEAEAVATASTAELLETTLNGKTSDATVPDSSASKENEQNGNVSSSEVNKKNAPSTSSSQHDATVSGSSDANKNDNKQNGNVESSTKSPTKQEANSSAITSTSKEKKKTNIDEDEEDAEFDESESNARQSLEYSSEDEEDIGEDDTTDEDADYDDDDEVEEDDEEIEDEEYEESYLANQQFCANMIEEPGKDSGCTAVVCLLNGRDLYVANAGDSRCVVCRNGKAIEMSLDHKPEDDEESARIIKAGGRVTLDGRVNGGLNLSRALGDHAYKMNHDLPAEEQMISALPDIKKLIISDDDEFMVLACDGIWNFMTSEEVVDFVRLRINDENKKMSEICEELFDACLAPNTLGDGTGCDNMTAVIVRFKPSILKLPTKVNPNETEDILLAKQEIESGQKAQKRVASPTLENNDSNEAENKTKRLKTDDEENKTSSCSSKMNSTSSSSLPANSTDDATTNKNEESSTTTVAMEVQRECDSEVASST